MTCAIFITTHNRRADLARTCAVIDQLQPPPDEVWICADACTDDTVAFLQKEHPGYRLVVREKSAGSIAARDHLMRRAHSDLLLSLDDDSHPIELDVIARVRALFALQPKLAVASFPQRSDEYPPSLTATSFGLSYFAGTYVNCACAFRRDVYLALGGHFLPFQHTYDEADYTARCAAVGWQVRFEPIITIRHHYSGMNRHEIAIHHLHARNELWSVLLRCPAPQCLLLALFRIARQFGYARKRGLAWMLREPRWWGRALAGLGHVWRAREPLPWRKYRAWVKLVHQPIYSETEWRKAFVVPPT